MTSNGSDHPEPYGHGKDFGFCSKAEAKALENVEQREKGHSGRVHTHLCRIGGEVMCVTSESYDLKGNCSSSIESLLLMDRNEFVLGSSSL